MRDEDVGRGEIENCGKGENGKRKEQIEKDLRDGEEGDELYRVI